MLTNASSNNGSKIMRGVPITPSLLNFGMFACSTTYHNFPTSYQKGAALDCLDNILVCLIFPLSRWFFLNCSSLTYVMLSLTVLQNYSLCKSLFISFETRKSGKTLTAATTTKTTDK